jgi:hypothetical protein
MSKHNNANTDRYKTAGRDPVGRNNLQHLEKQEYGELHARPEQAKPKKKKK